MRPLLYKVKRQWNNHSGQSILELAIFGSLLLFVLSLLIQYGLSLNYEQNFQMQTFRKALALARERANTSRRVELTVVKDQSIPNPVDQFGASETSPYTAQASAVWSEELMASYDSKLKPKVDLPHIDYIINGQPKSYTIANYGYFNCSATAKCWADPKCYAQFKMKENDLKDEYNIDGTSGSDNIYWYWKTVSCVLVEAQDSVDIDNCGKEESVYEISKADKNDPDSATDGIYYFKFQDGEIDTTKNKDLGEEPQGLQPEYTKSVKIEDTSLEKSEDKSQIKTQTKSKISETIKRIIKTNKGDEEVESKIERKEDTTWTTPY